MGLLVPQSAEVHTSAGDRGTLSKTPCAVRIMREVDDSFFGSDQMFEARQDNASRTRQILTR